MGPVAGQQASPTSPLGCCQPATGPAAVALLRRQPLFMRFLFFTVASLRFSAPGARGRNNAPLSWLRNNDAAVERRAAGLICVLAAVYALHGRYSDNMKLSSWGSQIACCLMLDSGHSGVAEKTLQTLSHTLQAMSNAKKARDDLRAASDALTFQNVLIGNLPTEHRPRPGEVPVLLNTADNADNLTKHSQASRVVLAATVLGMNVTAADVSTMKAETPNMPQPDGTTVKMHALSNGDKAVHEKFNVVMDVAVLRAAAAIVTIHPARGEVMADAIVRSTFKVGDAVKYKTKNGNANNAVVATIGPCGQQANITITYEGGVTEERKGNSNQLHSVVDLRFSFCDTSDLHSD